jgi:hypothetical protein
MALVATVEAQHRPHTRVMQPVSLHDAVGGAGVLGSIAVRQRQMRVPGLTTHAYLWTPPAGDAVLFYAPGSDADFDAVEALGGVGHQYLSHRDEAGPTLALLAGRFGARLHVPAAEADDIARFAGAGGATYAQGDAASGSARRAWTSCRHRARLRASGGGGRRW